VSCILGDKNGTLPWIVLLLAFLKPHVYCIYNQV
jgi:hypothetical protein